MNLRTLGDMKGDNKKDGKGKKQTESYAGGASSGMAVMNPDVQNIMSKAQKNSKSPEQFQKEEKAKDGNVCKITLYKNGFSVDDGQFQDYNDPKNKEFMKELNNGLIPKELRKKYPTGALSVSLSDKTGQAYVPPPPPPYVAFSGQGASLGGEQKKPSSQFSKKSKAQDNYILEPNRNLEVTTMRVRLANGTTITMEANLNSTVQNIHRHIATVSGVSNFDLVGGFPPKPLNMASTVEESDLADGTLIQKT